jgi:hypothetical protein
MIFWRFLVDRLMKEAPKSKAKGGRVESEGEGRGFPACDGNDLRLSSQQGEAIIKVQRSITDLTGLAIIQLVGLSII